MNNILKNCLIYGAKYGLDFLGKRLDGILESDAREEMKREILEELRGEINGTAKKEEK